METDNTLPRKKRGGFHSFRTGGLQPIFKNVGARQNKKAKRNFVIKLLDICVVCIFV